MPKRDPAKDQLLAAEAEAVAAAEDDRREAASVLRLIGSVEFLVSDEELVGPLYEERKPGLPSEDRA
jgi:hypothetical protein